MLDWLISKGSFYIYIYYSVKIIALICIVVTYTDFGLCLPNFVVFDN